ncbi:MAG: 2-hydroxyacyl-CoA dehydratase [Pygmaiobacter massiliensis]|nr:2-hydroxyacyl-CoA dehydratase [Pygmaiobacter massiliensis]
MAEEKTVAAAAPAAKPKKKPVSPGVLALRKVVDDVYAEARAAKERGELVGWSSSKFPCELAEAFDLHIMYPENQAAGIAANRYGELLCQAAEDLGYDNDICGYARISLAYAAGKRASRKYDPATGEYIIDPSTGKPLKDADGNVVIDPETGKPKKDPKTQTPYIVLDDINEIWAMPDGPEKERRLEAIAPIKQMQIPMPDFVLCCNNICNCMTKWYENIARMHNIPLVMIDIPYNNSVHVDDSYVAYIRGQFDNAIKQLEQISGKKFDQKKFEHACANANRTAQAWLKVCDYLQYKPAPYSGFDLFNHMADVVTARGKVAAAEAFEQLAVDLEAAVKAGESTTPFPEKYRVMFEGIPCWPKLPALFKPLKANGVNVTAVVYAPAFGFVYDDYDGMVRAYCKAPNSVCIEQGVDWREGICRDNKVDGVLVHYNRSCKPWSGYMAEMQRRFTADLGIPCAGFDGDQADPRNFNQAQYETRVQGLVEAMEANKAAKEEA